MATRWKPDPKSRLYEAAVLLFAEQGYSATSTAAIAAAAGLTERTFFRHFQDKKEVLFRDEDQIRTLLVQAIGSARHAEPTVAVVIRGLNAVCDFLQVHRDALRARSRIIQSSSDLQERERSKLTSWSSTVADAMMQRGTAREDAYIAAETGIALLNLAFRDWVENESTDMLARLLERYVTRLSDMFHS